MRIVEKASPSDEEVTMKIFSENGFENSIEGL
jgi:hypothetical protein